jgi:hypothetical protein
MGGHNLGGLVIGKCGEMCHRCPQVAQNNAQMAPKNINFKMLLRLKLQEL